MAIPDSVVEEVRRRADLLEMISEHTRLKRSGKTFRGPCPLHGGDGPNFSVDPARNVFKCFSCGEGGDVFSFPMKHLGMDFLEAVRYVAERAGVEIPDPREERAAEEPNRRYHETNAFAADWFRRQLWDGDEAGAARAYLDKRGIGREAAERFGLGWAPEEWTALGDAARKHGIPNELLLELGLVKESAKGGREPYDTFRGRLIFPIEDAGGRVIAFGGRILEAAEERIPKYLNSPETPVYHKGDVLYGLAWSRGAIRKAETALVVEGYMDYVALAAHGIENAVAPLGTAMTTEQAHLIARYAERAILLYDSDKAGLRATFRSGDELLRAGVEALVATLPEGEDPDSLVRGRGAAALGRYLDDAVDVLERKIQILERRDYFGSVTGTRRALDALLPTVRAASDDLLRGVYIGRIAERTGVPRATLEHEVSEAPSRDTRPPRAPERRRRNEGRRADDFTPSSAGGHAIGPERNLLLLLLRDDSWVERAAQELSPRDLRDPTYRTIFEALLVADGSPETRAAWLDQLPAEVIRTVEELRADAEAEHLAAPAEFFSDSLRMILARPYLERLSAIDSEIQTAPVEARLPLLIEMTEIRTTMRERGLPLRSGWLRDSAGDSSKGGR